MILITLSFFMIIGLVGGADCGEPLINLLWIPVIIGINALYITIERKISE